MFHHLTLNLDRVRAASSPLREMLEAIASGLSPISTYVRELLIEPPYCCASHENVEATTADSTHAQLVLTALRQLNALRSFTYVGIWLHDPMSRRRVLTATFAGGNSAQSTLKMD